MYSSGTFCRHTASLKTGGGFVVIIIVVFCITACCCGQTKEQLHRQESTYHESERYGLERTEKESLRDTRSQDHAETLLFLQKLFDKYGADGLMTFEGFEHLLQSLGIGKIQIEDHDINAHRSNGTFITFHDNHNHTSEELGSLGRYLLNEKSKHDSHESHSHKVHHDSEETPENEDHDLGHEVHEGHSGHDQGDGDGDHHDVGSRQAIPRDGHAHHHGNMHSGNGGDSLGKRGQSRSLSDRSESRERNHDAKNNSGVLTITSMPAHEDSADPEASSISPTKAPCGKKGKRKHGRRKDRRKDKANKNESIPPISSSSHGMGGTSKGGGTVREKRSVIKDDNKVIQLPDHLRFIRAVASDDGHDDYHENGKDPHHEDKLESSKYNPLEKVKST